MGSFIFQLAMAVGLLSTYISKDPPEGIFLPTTTPRLYGYENKFWLMMMHFIASLVLFIERSPLLAQPWKELPLTIMIWGYIVSLMIMGDNLRLMFKD